MINLNKKLMSIAKVYSKRYARPFKSAVYNQALCTLAAFDSWCTDSGVTIRQEEKVLNAIYLDIAFLDNNDLDDVIDAHRWDY